MSCGTDSGIDEYLWLEDFAVYRDTNLMMGVISHEGMGFLRTTEPEVKELRDHGFPVRDNCDW